MNKTNKQFYKDVYNLFPIHKQKERNYLNKLKKQIDECEIDSYEQLEKLFGTNSWFSFNVYFITRNIIVF